MLVDKRFNMLIEGKPQSLDVLVSGVNSEGWFDLTYTCDGEDRPTLVKILNIPENTNALALIMYDPDAPVGTFIHWLAIIPSPKNEETLPSSQAIEGRNDFGRIGYGGPCPPRWHGVHRYFYLALALDTKLGLKRGFRLNDLLKGAEGHVLSWGYTFARYKRG